MEISKKDWKLYREKIGNWQERYMKKLCEQYISLLNDVQPASDKFWHLEQRIKEDKKYPGVLIEMNKRTAVYTIVTLLKDEVIQIEDLDGFSEELKDYIGLLLKM